MIARGFGIRGNTSYSRRECMAQERRPFFGLYSLYLTMTQKNRYASHRIHSIEEYGGLVWTNSMQCRCSFGQLKKVASPLSRRNAELVSLPSASRSPPLKMNWARSLFTAHLVPLR